MSETIFDKIAAGTMDAYVVWQDDNHMAFLTPFPNTPGLTVLIPKKNIGDDFAELSESEFAALQIAAQKVAKILKKAFDVTRVALVIEGTGVAYVHVKLYPLHGDLMSDVHTLSHDTEFVEKYRGFLTTIEGPKMDDDKLRAIQDRILGVQQ
ncbi:HIT family protein [Candidatus Saccharibacteria bacterium]|nr:HIT family protein [Candidatus Saccharibacteria bacterium]MCL1962999.1 HIT family protein [Candidatus Saccharibacteria bacterium]